MAKMLKLCAVHSFSTSTNSHHHTTVTRCGVRPPLTYLNIDSLCRICLLWINSSGNDCGLASVSSSFVAVVVASFRLISSSSPDGLLMWQLGNVRTSRGDLMLAFARHCSARPCTPTNRSRASRCGTALDVAYGDTPGWPCPIYHTPWLSSTRINIHCRLRQICLALLPRWHCRTNGKDSDAHTFVTRPARHYVEFITTTQCMSVSLSVCLSVRSFATFRTCSYLHPTYRCKRGDFPTCSNRPIRLLLLLSGHLSNQPPRSTQPCIPPGR